MNAESTLLLSELPYYAMVTGAPHFNDPHHTALPKLRISAPNDVVLHPAMSLKTGWRRR